MLLAECCSAVYRVVCGVLGLMRCVRVLAVLQLNEEDTAGDTQQNGDLNLDDQTQMTYFEINLKDKRFVEVLPF